MSDYDDRDAVKKLTIIKFWNDRSEYDPNLFFDKIRDAEIDFTKVQYLLKNQEHPREDLIKDKIHDNYKYLTKLDEDLKRILMDTRKHREENLVKRTVDKLRNARKMF